MFDMSRRCSRDITEKPALTYWTSPGGSAAKGGNSKAELPETSWANNAREAQPSWPKTYFRTDCFQCQRSNPATASAMAYRTERVQPLLRTGVNQAILLNGLEHDIGFGLPAFANGFHLKLHLRAVSGRYTTEERSSSHTSLRRKGLAKLVSKPILS